MNQDRLDEEFMKIAIREAKKGLGRTSPNPPVGAVIVKDGRIISRGYHKGYGLPHAEIEALKKIDFQAKDATLYVTLEPCNHYGKTPPCTNAIIESGIKRVVIGIKDPNPHVKGGGVEFLRENGIEVKVGILEKECKEINKHFVKFVTTGIPFVSIKVAMTLDGWIATKKGHSKWITNEKSRRFVHKLRDISDAILVGIGTVITDNPMLNTRIKGGRDPIKVILDPHLRIPKDANVLRNRPEKTILVVSEAYVERKKAEEFKKETGADVIFCPFLKGKEEFDILKMLKMLGKRNITSILIEGGAKVISSFVRQGQVDEFFIFKAPKLLCGNDGIPMIYGSGVEKMDDAIRLRDVKIKRFGDDVLIQGYPIFG